jgi:prepilin-type N-terminal cleavage/methylation domain-containing protein
LPAAQAAKLDGPSSLPEGTNMTITLSDRRRGFTLIEIMITVAIIGLILGIALPAFVKSRTQARRQVCIENISQIESAKQQWGLEAGKKEGDAPAEGDLVGANLYMKRMPECPGAGTYDLKSIGTVTTCTLATAEGHIL